MTPEQHYTDWFRKLMQYLKGYDLRPEDFAQEDWIFDWHEAWAAGAPPRDAYFEAYRQMFYRGQVDENGWVIPQGGHHDQRG